jgi:uncharacterized protein (TIGR02569 family)
MAVLRAYGLDAPAVPLAGGQHTAWRTGAAVLKPLDMHPAAVQWQGEVLRRLDGGEAFRISTPLQATDGRWTVAGWTAWRYQPGAHAAGRWQDIISVGRLLHTALRAEPKPDFLSSRTDRWAIGDRVAWGELPPDRYAEASQLRELFALLRPVQQDNQLIHGDLTGNVLFHEHEPPLVIDLAPYWRPALFASAIVVADALVFEGAGPALVQPLLADPEFPQFLLRALIYRLVTDRLAGSGARPDGAFDRYLPAIELAVSLVG